MPYNDICLCGLSEPRCFPASGLWQAPFFEGVKFRKGVLVVLIPFELSRRSTILTIYIKHTL